MRGLFALLAVCAWFAAAPPARACTGLGCNCTVSALDAAFGEYDPRASAPDTTLGRVSVTCSALVAVGFTYSVKLSGGGAGDVMARRMSSPNDVLAYQLYMDAGYATVWGEQNGAGVGYVSETYTLTIAPFGRTVHYDVNARIPALQNVRAGAYADTITVTVDF